MKMAACILRVPCSPRPTHLTRACLSLSLFVSLCLSVQVLLNANADVNQTTSDGALEKGKRKR